MGPQMPAQLSKNMYAVGKGQNCFKGILEFGKCSGRTCLWAHLGGRRVGRARVIITFFT